MKSERGNEIIQAVLATSFVLVIVFAVIQLGGMMLSLNRLSADLSRAGNQMDMAGLALATNKEEFVKAQIIAAASQLRSELLSVENVVVVRWEDERVQTIDSNPQTIFPPRALLEQDPLLRETAPQLVQRTGIGRVSFDVSYEMPTVFLFPGLAHQSIARHITCSQEEGRTVEVEGGLL